MGRLLFVATLLVVSLPSSARAENPWEDLMGPGKPVLWTDPQGRFYLDLPLDWKAGVRKGAESFVDFWKTHPDHGYSARVEVEMRTVPPGTKAGHVATRIEDDLKKNAPQFRVLDRDQIPVSGTKGRRILFTFQERNNAQLLNEVVQVVFVTGERAFIVSLVTASGTRGVFQEDFEKMIKGFGGRSPSEDSLPMPKAKKKIRSGEMVNPDAVGY